MPDAIPCPAMSLPKSISLRETMHGHGAKGMAFYGYEDTAGLGVQMEARRKDSRSPFVETWFHDALFEREFPTYGALHAAFRQLTPEQVQAELAKYPRWRETKPDTCGNPCRLCPRPPYTPGERVKHKTWRVAVAVGWRAITDQTCSLCDEHLAQFDGKPVELVAALEAEVAARRARSAAKGFKW